MPIKFNKYTHTIYTVDFWLPDINRTTGMSKNQNIHTDNNQKHIIRSIS